MDERALAAWQRALVNALVGAEAPAQVRERLRAHPDAPHFTEMLDRLDDRGLAIAIALVARWSRDPATG
jgi:hypothetical protein